MLGYFLLGIALLVLLLAFARLLVSVPPRQLLAVGKWMGLGALGGGAVLLAASGRLSWLFTALVALLPWLVGAIERSRARRAAAGHPHGAGTGAGQASEVRTATLRMVLDHRTGSLDGEVLSGPFAGRWLSDLDLADLQRLLESCRRDDSTAVSLLEAYLDRHHPGWRAGGEDAGPAAEPAAPQTMTEAEAWRILGLEPGASDDAVRAAHRRLIAGLHPDRGGSPFLAALINRARDILLNRRRP